MVDEIFDRLYQEQRAHLNAGVSRLFGQIGQEIGKGLKALHHFEWNAPWAKRAGAASKDVGCA